MDKRPHFEDDNNFTKQIKMNEKSPQINKIQQSFWAVISDIPAETEKNELIAFVQQFGEINNLWFENSNGKENRQAIIFFKYSDSLKKIQVESNHIFKYNLIFVDLNTSQLKILWLEYDQLLNSEQNEESKNNLMSKIKQGIISTLSNSLKYINERRNIFKTSDGQWPHSTGCELLESKIICQIIQQYIERIPACVKETEKNLFPQEILKYIHSISTHSVASYHIQALNVILEEGTDKLKNLLKMNGGLQTLSSILEHSSIIVKSCAISSIFHLLNINENRTHKRSAFPQFEDLRRDGIIFFINHNCLQNGETQEMKQLASIIIGKILRSYEIEQNLKQQLIAQLKKNINNDSKQNIIQESLDVLCGLAVIESNIPEIVSDKLIDQVKLLIKSLDSNVRVNSLELLSILALKGGVEVEYQVRNSIGDLELLQIIGEFDSILDEQALEITMKWNSKNELQTLELLKLKQLYQIQKEYKLAKNRRKNEILKGELITQIVSLISYLNGQLCNSKQEQLNEQQVSILNIGLINSCCSIISKIVDDNNSIMHLIMDSEIPQQLIMLTNLTPLNQIKLAHVNTLSIIIQQCSYYYKQQLFNHGIVSTLSRILTHHSSQCIEKFPTRYQHPNLKELQNKGIIEQIYNCIISQKSNKNISLKLSKLFCQLFRGCGILQSIKQIIIQSIDNKIEENLIQSKDINDELDHLALLSLNDESIQSILESNYILILNEYKFKFNFKLIQRIIQIYINLFENGKENIRQFIKEFQSIEQIETLVNRNNQSNLFYIENSDVQKQRSETAYQQMNFNKFVFKLLAWFKEQEKMNQLKILRNSICIEQINDFKDDNEIKILKRKKNEYEINKWKNIEKMIQIVKLMNDYELAEGAMLMVSEAAYSILFNIAQQQDSKLVLTSMTAFHKIINKVDNFILSYLIDENLIKLIRFIIEDKIQYENYLLIKEKSFNLLSNISYRGSLMTYDLDINQFQRIFDNQNIIEILGKEIQKEIKQRNINSQKYITQKNIKLHAVICLGCMKNNIIENDNILKQCSKVFHDKINSFKSNIKQQQIQSTEEIELFRQILISYYHFSFNLDDREELGIQLNDYNLMPILHINCNCFNSIELDESSSISNLISVAYFTLSHLTYQHSKKEFRELEYNEGIISHVSQFIRKQLKQSKQNPDSLNSHRQTAENLGLVQYFLSSLINDEYDKIPSQILSEPGLIQNIIDIISDDVTIGASDHEKNLLKQRCLIIIKQFNKHFQYTDSWELFQKLQIKETFTKLLCCAGGVGNDNDNVVSISTDILVDILSNQISPNKMLTIIEEEGLIEEIEDLNFHSDSREKVGVLENGSDLKQELVSAYQIYKELESEDQSESESDESDQ